MEASQGLLLYQSGMDAEVRAWANQWWNSLTEEEQAEARREADWYESLSEEQRDALWNQFPVSIKASSAASTNSRCGGLDVETGALGVEYLVTTDLGMATNFSTHFSEIKRSFDQMVVNLPAPYQQATLPQIIITPRIVLTKW